MAIEFNMVITREGLDFAREASANANWHLIPKRYAISATAGELSETRDYTSMLSTWTSSAMTSLLNGTNKIQTNVVINASASGIDRQIGEIYFIFTNESHEEFLFAIAQPSTKLMFTPGVQQNYIFVWTLNNANVQDIVEINYSFAEDIDAHNNDPDAHSYLLARDGSRTATDILRYATNLTFTNNYDIVNKRYVDNQVSTGANSHNTNTSAHSYLLARDGSRTATGILRYDSNKSFTNNLDIVNKYYVDTQINTIVQEELPKALPVGTVLPWMSRSTSYPSGFLYCNGAAISRTTYSSLYSVIGTTYGTGNGSSTFNIPDLRGCFLRGDGGNAAAIGTRQNSGAPNITGTFSVHEKASGAFYISGESEWHGNRNNNGNKHDVTFDASRVSSVYQNGLNEVRPVNYAAKFIIKAL